MGDEVGKEIWALERECIGGVDHVVRFVINLSTCAEKIDGRL